MKHDLDEIRRLINNVKTQRRILIQEKLVLEEQIHEADIVMNKLNKKLFDLLEQERNDIRT